MTSEQLKRARKLLGDISQQELADLMNVSRRAVTRWESDNPATQILMPREKVEILRLIFQQRSLPFPERRSLVSSALNKIGTVLGKNDDDISIIHDSDTASLVANIADPTTEKIKSVEIKTVDGQSFSMELKGIERQEILAIAAILNPSITNK